MNINRKGYIYTLTAIVLVLTLIFFIAFYSRTTETEIEDVSGKISCDGLHFFVEDVKVDLERGLMITGRRASIYAISNQIMGKNVIDSNYRFSCNTTSPCYEQCSKFNYSGTGAEAAVAELMFCGTLNGIPNEYMTNHTVKAWIDKLQFHAEPAGFNAVIIPTEFKITPYDAWNFASVLDLSVNITESSEMCYYSLFNVTINFITPLNDIEDPLYPDNTERKAAKVVQDCGIQMHVKLPGEGGTRGWGWVVGNSVRINNMSAPEIGKLSSADKSKIIIINYDKASDLLNGSYNSDLINYGGIITNRDTPAALVALDNVSIPYLTTTSTRIIYGILDDTPIVMLATKYYFIDTTKGVTCDGTNCDLCDQNGTCLITHDNWFTDSLQTCDDGHYPVGFSFPEHPGDHVSPQLETNKTWQYNLYYPVNVKDIHLIMSSSDPGAPSTAAYNITLIYFDGTNNLSYPLSVKVCGHCDTDPVCQTGEPGKYYDSHYVSKNSPGELGVFYDAFSNVTSGGCGSAGETVQHVTIKASEIPGISGYPITGISITNPYNDSENKDLSVWAVTIEMAPMGVWELNVGSGNYTNSALFACYNVSTEGPSFFDRIENNKVLTAKYRDQTNNTIGLESFLSISRLNQYGVNVSSELTSVDYLYFAGNETGYPLIGANETGIDYFRIDPDYAIKYGVYDLINWNDYTTPAYENCSPETQFCEYDAECCGALICFDYYYLDNSNDSCHNCLNPGQYCNTSSPLTLHDAWCCNPPLCSTETYKCCAATETNCSDGLDDDCDGLRDCCDPECGSMPYCTAIESSNISFCNDTIDNNCNNLTDCNDASCYGLCPYCKIAATENNCTNGIDEDCDTLIDCNDTLQCFGCPFCPKAENCTNGIDDNCNGLIDCEDPACPVCTEKCFDNVDNDNDTKIDCQDTDCPSPCTPCQNSTCSGAMTYDWSCTTLCPGTNTSCGCASCTNCNTNGTGAGRTGDGCLGTSYIDYYCSGTSCTYSSDSCSDCSCTCGGYNTTESIANGNCNDSKDNDCNGNADMTDPKCITDTTPPTISNVEQDKPSAWTTSSTTQDAIHSGKVTVNVRAIINDANGISSVKLYYKISSTKPASRTGFSGPITMSLSGGYYQTTSAIPKSNNNHFWYYINATDNSVNKNWATSPTDSAPPNFWTYYCG